VSFRKNPHSFLFFFTGVACEQGGPGSYADTILFFLNFGLLSTGSPINRHLKDYDISLDIKVISMSVPDKTVRMVNP
jgi:hypothetical protein